MIPAAAALHAHTGRLLAALAAGDEDALDPMVQQHGVLVEELVQAVRGGATLAPAETRELLERVQAVETGLSHRRLQILQEIRQLRQGRTALRLYAEPSAAPAARFLDRDS